MPTVYSHSRLSSFENCKKQFHFRYVLEVPTDTEGIEAFVVPLGQEFLRTAFQKRDMDVNGLSLPYSVQSPDALLE